MTDIENINYNTINELKDSLKSGTTDFDAGYASFARSIEKMDSDQADTICRVYKETVEEMHQAFSKEDEKLEAATEKYNVLIKFLNKRFPDLSAMFKRGVPVERQRGIGSGRIISPEGMCSVVSYLQNKGSLPVDVKVFGKRSEFKQALAHLQEETENTPVGYAMGIVVKPSTTHHLTPLYLRKEDDDTFSVFICDSLGASSLKPGGYYEALIKTINESRLNVGNIIVSNVSRQTDHTNCPIFSARDLAVVTRFDDIFKFLHEEGELETTVVAGKEILVANNLPAEMMKVTQSGTKINEYVKKHNLPQKSTLLVSTQKHTVVYEEKKMKWLVLDRFFKYEGEVIRSIVNRSINSSS